MQKYKQVYDRSLHQYVLIADDDGDLYTEADVEEELARLKAEAELLKAALQWLMPLLSEYGRLEAQNCAPPQFAPLIAEATKHE